MVDMYNNSVDKAKESEGRTGQKTKREYAASPARRAFRHISRRTGCAPEKAKGQKTWGAASTPPSIKAWPHANRRPVLYSYLNETVSKHGIPDSRLISMIFPNYADSLLPEGGRVHEMTSIDFPLNYITSLTLL